MSEGRNRGQKRRAAGLDEVVVDAAARVGANTSALPQIGVTIAMGLVSFATAVGFYAEGHIGSFTALVGGISGFIFLFSVHGLMRHYKHTLELTPRIDAVEESVGRLAEDIDLLESVADKFDQLEDLSQQVAEIQLRFHEDPDEAAYPGNGASPGLLQEIANLEDEIRGIRADLEQANKDQRQRLDSELQVLQTLIKQIAEQFAGREGQKLISALPKRVSEPVSPAPAQEAPIATAQPMEPETALAEEEDSAPHTVEHRRNERAAAEDEVDEAYVAELEEAISGFDHPAAEPDMLDVVRQSIEKNNVELYLQPIFGLPDQKVHFYEALTRLRTTTGDLVLPSAYIDVAEQAGIMPLIDNVMLFRSVQVIRRLTERDSPRGVFCNISPYSLLDPEFFPEFIDFMAENKHLANHLFFEFSQPMIRNAGTLEIEGLNALADLGFRFSMDQVTNLNIDFEVLEQRAFRFLKLDVRIFLHGMADAGARIHAADMADYLKRYGIDLIIEKVEDERSVASLVDYGVKLGQGYLFSEPRPVRPEIFGQPAMTQAA